MTSSIWANLARSAADLVPGPMLAKRILTIFQAQLLFSVLKGRSSRAEEDLAVDPNDAGSRSGSMLMMVCSRGPGLLIALMRHWYSF